MTAVAVTARGSLPVPATLFEPLAHMLRRGGRDAHRFLVLRDGDPDLARMQMQPRLPEARPVAVDVVADDRPGRCGRMHAQLMGAAGHGFHGEPGEAVATSEHLP